MVTIDFCRSYNTEVENGICIKGGNISHFLTKRSGFSLDVSKVYSHWCHLVVMGGVCVRESESVTRELRVVSGGAS